MSADYKQQIERGIELLKLCQQLQSEKDGIDRPEPFVIDKTKTLDQFAQDIAATIFNISMLNKLLPMMMALSELGQKLHNEGKIVIECEDYFSTGALAYVLRQNELDQARWPDYSTESKPPMSKISTETEIQPVTKTRRAWRSSLKENAVQPNIENIEQKLYQQELNRPAVQQAIFAIECAQAKRDSISRKLCGDSTAVTVADLAYWEEELKVAKAELHELATKTAAILMRHPLLAVNNNG